MMPFLTAAVLAAFVGYAGAWYFEYVEGNFALLLFLWVTFGGPVPLKSKSYRITAYFPEAVHQRCQVHYQRNALAARAIEVMRDQSPDAIASAGVSHEPPQTLTLGSA
mgnify:CR=1 FL=1